MKERNCKYPQDAEGVEIRRGDLVYYSGEVWKVLGWRIDSHTLPKYLNLKNNRGTRNGVKDSNVECLGSDTITGMTVNGESKKPGNSGVHLPFKVGDHVCTRVGTFRTGKVVYADSAYVKIEVWEAGGCKTVKYRVDDVEHIGQQNAQRAFDGGGGSVIDISEREQSGLSSYYDDWWNRHGNDRNLRQISSRSRKPSKRHSISTGELIEDEARRLREDGSPPKEGGEDNKPKIKKRKGDW